MIVPTHVLDFIIVWDLSLGGRMANFFTIMAGYYHCSQTVEMRWFQP